MLRGLYTAGTGMITNEKRMTLVSNNLANATTTGYKSDAMIAQTFDDMLLERINDDTTTTFAEVGPVNYGIHIEKAVTDFTQGSLEDTGKASDFAIIGDGFFEVATPNGSRYTRAGNFTFDADGSLLTTEGHHIMGTNGPIQVNPKDFYINSAGEIFSDGQKVNEFRLVSFSDNSTLKKEGSNLYSASEPGYTSDASIKQYALEGSNVDLTREYISMMEISRNYETNQRMIQMLDQTLGRAVNDIGKV